MNAASSNVRQLPVQTPQPLVPIPPGLPKDLRKILAEGVDITNPIRFGDDLWDLSGAKTVATTTKSGLNFTGVPDQFRDAAKLFMIAASHPAAVANVKGVNGRRVLAAFSDAGPANWQTVYQFLGFLRSTLKSLIEHWGDYPSLKRHDWSQVANEWAAYTYERNGVQHHRTATTHVRMLTALRQFSDVCEAFGSDGPLFGTRPFGRSNPSVFFPHDDDGLRNKTEPVLRTFALFGADENYVNVTAPDLVPRVEWWTKRITKTHPTKKRDEVAIAVWREAVDIWEQAGFDTLPTRPKKDDKHPGRLDELLGQGQTVATEVVLQFAGWEPKKVPADYLSEAVESDRFRFVDVADHVDPYCHVTGEAPPEWLDDNAHLLPTAVAVNRGGLWDHVNALVWACANGLMVGCALRNRELSALEPGCLKQKVDDDGRVIRWFDGARIKNQNVLNPPRDDWFVSERNARFLEVANGIRKAYDLPDEDHPTYPRKMLFSAAMLQKAWGSRPDWRRRHFEEFRDTQVAIYEGLANTGWGLSIADIEPVTASQMRISSLTAMVKAAHGHMAAQVHAKHTTLKVALPYYRDEVLSTSTKPPRRYQWTPAQAAPFDPSNINELVNAHADDVEDYRVNGDLLSVVDKVMHNRSDLSGPGVGNLTIAAFNDGLINGTDVPVTISSKELARRVKEGQSSSVLVGVFSVCTSPKNGLCKDDTEARITKCVLGCHNQAFTSSQRAILELQHRYLIEVFGPDHIYVAKLENHDDIVGDFAERQTDELVDIAFAEFDPEERAFIQGVMAEYIPSDDPPGGSQ